MRCGNCGRSLEHVLEFGTSVLYYPNGSDIDLCIHCYWEEDALTEKTGTNDHPERLAHYLLTLGNRREAERIIATAKSEGRL